jgi:hypothetical protein
MPPPIADAKLQSKESTAEALVMTPSEIQDKDVLCSMYVRQGRGTEVKNIDKSLPAWIKTIVLRRPNRKDGNIFAT